MGALVTVLVGVVIFVVGFPLFYRALIRWMAILRPWQDDPIAFFAPGTRARLVRNIVLALFVWSFAVSVVNEAVEALSD